MWKKCRTEIKAWKESYDNDPVHNCKIYKDFGCSHVGGMLCDMKTCTISMTVKTTPTKRNIIND